MCKPNARRSEWFATEGNDNQQNRDNTSAPMSNYHCMLRTALNCNLSTLCTDLTMSSSDSESTDTAILRKKLQHARKAKRKKKERRKRPKAKHKRRKKHRSRYSDSDDSESTDRSSSSRSRSPPTKKKKKKRKPDLDNPREEHTPWKQEPWKRNDRESRPRFDPEKNSWKQLQNYYILLDEGSEQPDTAAWNSAKKVKSTLTGYPQSSIFIGKEYNRCQASAVTALYFAMTMDDGKKNILKAVDPDGFQLLLDEMKQGYSEVKSKLNERVLKFLRHWGHVINDRIVRRATNNKLPNGIRLMTQDEKNDKKASSDTMDWLGEEEEDIGEWGAVSDTEPETPKTNAKKNAKKKPNKTPATPRRSGRKTRKTS